jgi:DNA-binding NarL/FixJ family response regulator
VGGTGYLWKATNPDEFSKAFHKVLAGQRYVSHELASDIVFMEVNSKSNPLGELTVREWQTLSLLADGKSYGAIADELHVSYKTVANTASLVKSKLGAKSLPDLMRIAITHLPAEPGRRSLSVR